MVPYSYDLEKSKTLLANAGWKDTDADGVLDKLIQGKKVKLRKDNRVFEAMINGVNENGQLETAHAIPEAFDFGTIEWVN